MKKTGILLTVILFSTQGFSKELTLNEIIKEYMSYSPALKSAKAQSLSAHHEFKEAVTKFFPSLSLNGSYQTLQHPAGSIEGSSKLYQARVDLKQNLFHGGALWRGYSVKRLNKKLKELEYLKTKQDLLEEFITRVFLIDNLESQHKILLNSQSYQRRFFQLTKTRRRSGAARDFEYHQSQANLLSYASRIDENRRHYQESYKSLMTSLGRSRNSNEKDSDKNSIIKLPSHAYLSFEKHNEKESVEKAKTSQPELRIATVLKEMAHEEKWLNLSQDLPKIDVVGSLGYQAPSIKDAQKYTSMTLQLSIPLSFGLLQKYKKETQNIYAAKYSFQSQRDRLINNVALALKNIKGFRKSYKHNQAWAKSAKKSRNLSLRSYRRGTISISEVIQIQKGWEQAELSLLQSKLSLQLSILKFRKSLGENLEDIYTKK